MKRAKRLPILVLGILLVLMNITNLVWAGGNSQKQTEEITNGLIKVEFMLVHDTTLKDEAILAKKYFKDKFNIDVVFTTNPSSAHMEKMNLLIAANQLPELISPMPLVNAKSIGPKGALIALNKYFDIMPNFEQYVKENTKIYTSMLAQDGNIYNIPSFAKRLHFKQIPGIRMDLVKDVGMQAPNTYNELFDVLKAIKQKYPNTVGIVNRDKMGFIQAYGRTFGTMDRMFYNMVDDKWEFGPANDGFKEMLMFFQKLWNEKLLDPDFFIASGDQWTEAILNNRGVFTLEWGDRILSQEKTYKKLNPADNKFSIELLMPLKPNESAKRIALREPFSNTWTAFGVSTNTKNVERVLEMIDDMFTEEGSTFFKWGVKGEHFIEENGRRKAMEHIVASYNPNGKVNMRNDHIIGSPHFARVQKDDELLPFFEEKINVLYNQYQKEVQIIDVNDNISLSFSEAENNANKAIESNLNTYKDEFVIKFITGNMTNSDYDNYIKKLKEMGVEKLEQTYAKAYSSFKEELKKL